MRGCEKITDRPPAKVKGNTVCTATPDVESMSWSYILLCQLIFELLSQWIEMTNRLV